MAGVQPVVSTTPKAWAEFESASTGGLGWDGVADNLHSNRRIWVVQIWRQILAEELSLVTGYQMRTRSSGAMYMGLSGWMSKAS